MAREYVSRRVVGTEVKVKVITPQTEAIEEITLLLDRKKADPVKLPKLVKKNLPEDKVLISVISYTEVSRLYGVKTSDFMNIAVELDPKTRKPIA